MAGLGRSYLEPRVVTRAKELIAAVRTAYQHRGLPPGRAAADARRSWDRTRFTDHLGDACRGFEIGVLFSNGWCWAPPGTDIEAVHRRTRYNEPYSGISR